MRILLTSTAILFSLLGFAQNEIKVELDTIHFKGKYTGKNLFVKNPFREGDVEGFTVQKVLIDEKPVEANFNASSFEVNFNERNKKIGDDLNLVIIHIKGFTPEILNFNAKDEE